MATRGVVGIIAFRPRDPEGRDDQSDRACQEGKAVSGSLLPALTPPQLLLPDLARPPERRSIPVADSRHRPPHSGCCRIQARSFPPEPLLRRLIENCRS